MMYCYKTGGIYQTVNGQGFYLHRMLAAKEFTKYYTKKEKGKKKKRKRKQNEKKPTATTATTTTTTERNPENGILSTA